MGDLPTGMRFSVHRLTRRRLIALVPGLLLAGCRRGETTPGPLATPTREASPTPAPVATRSPAVSTPALVQPTPSPTPTAVRTAVFVRLRLDEPRSHDFNADLFCGGEPELFAGLVRLTPEYEVRPDWAERWDVSADGTRWVFTVRQAAGGWSNGDPVRAADFVWSWRRMLDPAQPAPQSWLLDIVGNARAVRSGDAEPAALAARALDERTLEVELERPAGYFPLILGTAGLLPAHRPAVEQWGERWTEAGKCVSNGPFRLVSWEPGSGYVVSRNPHYWNQGMLVIDTYSVMLARPENPLLPFFQGRADIAPVPFELLPEVTSQEALLQQLERSVLPEVWTLVVQPDVPPLDRLDLRRAVSRALDRERLQQLVYGAVEPARALVPPPVPGFVDDEWLRELHRFAPLEASQRWSQVPDDQRGPVRVTAPADLDGVEEAVLLDVVEQLQGNLGIAVELERLEREPWERAVEEGAFQLLWWRWPLPFPDAAAVYEWLLSRDRKALRGLRWEHDELERFLALARNETSTLRRLGAYRQCELLVQGACVVIPVVYPVVTYLVQPWVASLPRARDGMVVGPGLLFHRFASSVVLGRRSG